MLPSNLLPDFRVRQRDYLLEISRLLTQELDLEKLLARILRVSIEMLAGQAGLIALKQPEGWRVSAAHGIAPAFMSYLEPLLEEESSELDVVELNRMLKELTYTASMGLLNGTGLPLVAQGDVIGVIFIFRNYADMFTPNDRVLLQSFADQAAIAVLNAQLYGQVSYEKQRLDALLDSAADGILILDTSLVVERCNVAFEKMYGLTRAEIVGKGHEEIIRWKKEPQGVTLEDAIDHNNWPLTPNATLYVEGDLSRPAPTPLPVGITYAPLLAEGHKLRNVIVSVRDITHFRNADEIKATFISIVSHELRTPVALIKGYASTLRRDDAKWDKRTINESLAVIEEEADRLSKMVDDLLDASRLQAGGLTLNQADISLPGLAARVIERFASQAPKHRLSADFPAGFPVIIGDETRIEQVLANLVSNALKYAPAGKIEISGTIRPDQVIVCVSDEGKGIDTKDLPYIFDRFYRATTAVKHTKGAGLGLYLARAIVEAHGGRIWADANVGAGARICFSLPR